MACMGSIRRSGRALAPIVLAGSILALSAGMAGAAVRVGPSQYFTGVINGHDGNTVNPITIRMACAGPGETGHPVAGQTLAVHELFPPATSGGSLGFTGNDAEIGAFIDALPPSTPGGSVTTTPVFRRYDVTKPLPTSLTLPCSGTGTAYFVPIPVVPPSRDAGVPVRFVGQP